MARSLWNVNPHLGKEQSGSADVRVFSSCSPFSWGCSYLNFYINTCFDQEKSSCNINVSHLQRWLMLSPGAACLSGSSSWWSFQAVFLRTLLQTHSILEGCLFVRRFSKLLCSVITSFLYSKSALTHKFVTGMCFRTYTASYRTRGKVTVSKSTIGWWRDITFLLRVHDF